MTSISEALKKISHPSSHSKEDNLYNHLKKVISQLVISKQSVAEFEAVSSKVKADKKKLEEL